MRLAGFEPARLSAQTPQACGSTSFPTAAKKSRSFLDKAAGRAIEGMNTIYYTARMFLTFVADPLWMLWAVVRFVTQFTIPLEDRWEQWMRGTPRVGNMPPSKTAWPYYHSFYTRS